MKNDPIFMEDYFKPGFKIKPAVHVGSQSMQFYYQDKKEQAWEGMHLAASYDKDIVVVRDIDPYYLNYWKSLIGKSNIINIHGKDPGEFLSKVLLENPSIIDEIKNRMESDSKLMVYFPTEYEQKLADKLEIPLHGSYQISNLYGTKSGIRKLAKETHIPMPPGFICSTYKQVKQAIDSLAIKFNRIIIKHDLSSGGRWSKKVYVNELIDLKSALNEICAGKFTEGKDILVVEGWLKSKASLCAHIEIPSGQEPIVCAGWEQILDVDGISYLGAGPLTISRKALQSFYFEAHILANALKQKGAVGSFGPDFLVTADDEESIEPDTSVLIELNARIPVTPFSLEIIKQVKGKIGAGFYNQQINLDRPATFKEIAYTLDRENLLITKKDNHATGVVPYNIAHLPWQQFHIATMADSWEEVLRIVKKVNSVFNNFKINNQLKHSSI